MIKKWGIVLGLACSLLLGTQCVYAASENVGSEIKKGGFSAGASVHDPAAFAYVGKNEEGGYSVWAPDADERCYGSDNNGHDRECFC